jgi:hypothetical protein
MPKNLKVIIETDSLDNASPSIVAKIPIVILS